MNHFKRSISTLITLLLLISAGTTLQAYAKDTDHLAKANEYFNKGMLRKAETSYYWAKRATPNERSIYSALATIQRINKDYSRGLKTINGALTIFPSDPDFLIEKAKFEYQLGEEEEMHSSLSAAYEQAPRNVRILESIAGFYKSISRPIKAEEYSDARKRVLGIPLR